MLPPGSTIGMLGGGQLGRMSILAGMRMGYRFRVFDPAAATACLGMQEAGAKGDFEDEAALEAFARACDVVTLEFENISARAVEVIDKHTPVRPGAQVLSICQNRRREKEFLRAQHLPHAEFCVVESAAQLTDAVAKIGTPCVLKTADFGYDGKGQVKISDADTLDAAAVWQELDAPAGIVESWIPFEKECSVICARNVEGAMVTFPMAENIHVNHILHQSLAPARIDKQIQHEGAEIAKAVAEALDVVGLITAELFLTREGKLLVNELAPRPHNSGHHTFDACVTSQFEQHIRAVCGLPLGDTSLLSPACMTNLLGNLWPEVGEPDWSAVLNEPRAKLHLYDKGAAKKGRKMGHMTFLADSLDDAKSRADAVFEGLSA